MDIVIVTTEGYRKSYMYMIYRSVPFPVTLSSPNYTKPPCCTF